MIRLAFSFLMSVATYQWVLNEVELMSPELGDELRELTSEFSFPTHDQWPLEEAQAYLGELLESELLSSEQLAKLRDED